MTVIIDYGAGNTSSVMNTLDRLGANYVLSSDISDILASERLILPGVGHAAQAMEALRSKELVATIQQYKKPFLGICLGMQVMYDHSDEGDTTCLGLIKGRIRRFVPKEQFKVPHMGWNDFIPTLSNPLFYGLSHEESVYFVHSYYASVSESSIGNCDYLGPFCAAVQYKNFYGVQFHPEKSGKVGQKILSNFMDIS